MRDGTEVAAALIEGEWDWVEVVREFEAKMFPRAEVATVGARDGVEATFSEGGLAHLLKHVQETGV